MLDTVQNLDHIQAIVEAITPYTPGLLLDQYGNYVVQCCLRFPNNKNQFIFSAVSANMLKIGQARFGSRATRTCLESQYVSKSQIRLVQKSIIKNSFELSCDQNGSLLMSWLLDSCTIPGRLVEVASIYKQHLVACGTHKIASAFVLKICLQKSEPEARAILLKEIFTKNLVSILADPMNGTSLVRKILNSMANTSEQQEYIKEISMIITRFDIQKHQNIKRFLDEFSVSLANDNISR